MLPGKALSDISREIDEYNQAAYELTRTRACHYIDITDLSREAAQDAALLAPDGLHPSGKDYARWAARVVEWVRSLDLAA